jgi:hypothetical protein
MSPLNIALMIQAPSRSRACFSQLRATSGSCVTGPSRASTPLYKLILAILPSFSSTICLVTDLLSNESRVKAQDEGPARAAVLGLREEGHVPHHVTL